MKALIKKLLLKSGVAGRLIARSGRDCVVMFHGVGGPEMPAAPFAELIGFLAGHYEFAAMDQLCLAELGGSARRASRPRVYLTFDDGMRNNLTEAMPVMAKHRANACFYVCPELIEQKCWIWTHEMRLRLVEIDLPGRAEILALSGAERWDVEAMVAVAKKMGRPAREAFLERIRALSAAFTILPWQRRAYDLMTWEDLALVDRELFTIGSHTMSHQPLGAATNADELRHEMEESRRVLEAKTGRPVRHFCYPDGSTSPAAVAMAGQSYDTAVTTRFGALDSHVGLHQVPRIGSDPDLAEFCWRLIRSLRG